MASGAVDAARLFISGPSDLTAAQDFLASYPLPVLCEVLAQANQEDADPLESALERLADFEEVRQTLLHAEMLDQLKLGATATSSRIRKLVTTLVRRLSHNEAGAKELLSSGLYDACEQLLLDDDTGVGEGAARALCAAIALPTGWQAVLGQEDGSSCIAGRLQSLSSVPDVQRIRVLCFFVDLGRKSINAFNLLEKRGAFKAVLDAFFTDDILLKLNAVELMDSLGTFPAGQDLLSREGVPAQLVKELTDPMNDMSVQLCVVRLLGSVLQRHEESAGVLLPDKTAPFPATVMQFLDSTDTTLRLCALNSVADACTHNAGLAFFLRWPEPLGRSAAHIGASNNEVCKGAMASWSAVLRKHEALPPAVEEGTSSMTVALWSIADKSVLPAALKCLAGKPFQDVRQETWRLLAVLGRSRDLARKMLSAAEIRERLLDFSSETTYEAKIAKHDFVTEIVKLHDSWLASFLDEQVEMLLQQMAKQGPTWMPQEASLLVNKGTA